MERTIVERLTDIISEETRVIKKFCNQELEVKQHLFDKDWKNLNEAIKESQKTSEQIQELEEERNGVFDDLCGYIGEETKANFYHVIVYLPTGERDRLGYLYRELKMEVFRMQSITAGIDTYISSMRDTMNHVLEEVFPHRKGKIYAKDGRETTVETDPMVISHRL
jgi:predicted transcriptional regulator